jgi:hypothetical protein
MARGSSGKIRRLWQRDNSVWTGTDEDQWLGWLNSVSAEGAKQCGASAICHQWREGDVVMWDNRATMHPRRQRNSRSLDRRNVDRLRQSAGIELS